jgi:hypothetical protein
LCPTFAVIENNGNYSATRRQGLKPQAKQPKPTQVGWKAVRFERTLAISPELQLGVDVAG